MYNVDILKYTTKIIYDVDVPGNNWHKTSNICIEYPQSYLTELVQKLQEIFFSVITGDITLGGWINFG